MSHVDIDQVLLDAHMLGKYCVNQFISKMRIEYAKDPSNTKTEKNLIRLFADFLTSTPTSSLPYALCHQVLKSEVESSIFLAFHHDAFQKNVVSSSTRDRWQTFVREVSSGELFNKVTDMLQFMSELQSQPTVSVSKKSSP